MDNHAPPILACINACLSEDILSYIFSYLDVKTRLLFLPLVCWKWCNAITFHDIKECNIFDLHDEVCLLDFDCPLQKSFTTSTSDVDGDNPPQVMWICKFTSRCLERIGRGLRSLSLQTKGHQAISLRSSLVIRIELMEIILRYCPRIFELNLLRCRITQEAADMINHHKSEYQLFSHVGMDNHAPPILACINACLSEDILSYIFSYLDVKTRLLFLPLVCWKWCNAITFHDIKECNIFDLHDEVCLLDFDCPLQKSFTTSTSDVDGDNPPQVMWICKFTSRCLERIGRGLRSLSLQTKGHQAISLRSSLVIRIELMEIILRYCPRIFELNLLRCRITQEAADMISMFSCLNNLKINNQEILEKIWPDLCMRLDGFESWNNFGDSFVANHQFLGTGASKLQKLTLHADFMSPMDNLRSISLASVVECYPNLTELNIQTCKLGGFILSAISRLRFLKQLSIMIIDSISPLVLDDICRSCTYLKELTIIDRYSNGALNLDLVSQTCGSSLESFAINSCHSITADQLRAIKRLRNLKRLILRTTKLPPSEDATEKSECHLLDELTISSSNRDEKTQQYEIFLSSSVEGFSKLGYLPRGWSLHSTDGLETKTLTSYLVSSCNLESGQKKAGKLVKLILYATDSNDVQHFINKQIFTSLTGLIVFGKCELMDETCRTLAANCPHLSYILTESSIQLSPVGVANILKAPSLREAHFKYRDLEADEKFCFAIGRHPKLKYVSFRGMLMPDKMKLRSEHWDKIMEGRVELFKTGLTCERLFIDCFYEQRTWPRRLACAMRKLWISCRAMKIIKDEAP